MPAESQLNESSLHTLAGRVRGKIVSPSAAEYDTARAVWNGRHTPRPAAILYAEGTEDVAVGVRFAREHGLPLAVRGAGHHIGGVGVCDDGVTIDLSKMKSLEIDTIHNTARAGAGLTIDEFIRPLIAQERITTVGSHGSVGIAGMTLGGGMGILQGRYGLAIDNLISAEIVTADGERHIASADQNPDLFWAIRGGGGNFGIVTSLTYRVYPLEPTIAGIALHPLPRLREVLRFYRDFTQNLPDELTVFLNILTGPHGQRVCGLAACYTGALDEGEKLLAPLKEFGPPVMDMLHPAPYASQLDALAHRDLPGAHYAYGMRGILALTDTVIEAIANSAETITSPGTAILLYDLHGAARRVPNSATAFAAREMPYLLGIYAGWEGGDAAPHLAWRDNFLAALEAESSPVCCISFTGDEREETVRSTYADNYARLQRIKHTYDPQNLFRGCNNIAPSDTE